jgi:hypothetical protein
MSKIAFAGTIPEPPFGAELILAACDRIGLAKPGDPKMHAKAGTAPRKKRHSTARHHFAGEQQQRMQSPAALLLGFPFRKCAQDRAEDSRLGPTRSLQ